MADLEKERETIEEEKAQVDRYKQLLLKQRDIMIALTQRLNERDEQIMALQVSCQLKIWMHVCVCLKWPGSQLNENQFAMMSSLGPH